VANRTDRPRDIEARFRVDGKEAELWHPDTGEMEPASYSIENKLTTVPLHLDVRESVFVVLRKPAASPSREVPKPVFSRLATIEAPWRVSFQPELGAPPSIEMPKLQSWTENPDPGVKFFSGTATYTQTMPAPGSWFGKGDRIWLDLGNVRDIAEISINGKPFGTLWKPPYRIDVTNAIKAGPNQLEIKVTNQWSNRIAGDAAGGPRILSGGGGRGFGRGARGPADSGLLGPVTLISSSKP
jgi:hypothetical protein